MPIYMKYDGIDGQVTSAGHEKWIELESCQLGVNRMITSPSGRGANREASAPSVSEIVVTKVLDESSTNLLRESLWGKGKKVEIDFTRTGTDKTQTPYLKLTLENVLLSGLSMSSGGDRPTESLSLNFTKIEMVNLDSKATGEDDQPDRLSYDLSTGIGS